MDTTLYPRSNYLKPLRLDLDLEVSV